MNDLFPTKEERVKRKAALFNVLTDFLDHYHEMDGDGWPSLDRDDHQKLYDIIGEIIDLKFSRDCDGDRGIIFHVDGRRGQQVIHYTIPDLDSAMADEITFMTWLGEASSAAAYAQSCAETATRKVANATLFRSKRLREQLDQHQEYLKFINVAANADYAEAVDAQLEAYINFDSARLKNPGGIEFTPSITDVQRAFAARFPAELESAIVEVATLMIPYSDDCSTDYRKVVVGPRLKYAKLFGVAFTSDPRINEPANRHYRQGMAIRKAARGAGAS